MRRCSIKKGFYWLFFVSSSMLLWQFMLEIRMEKENYSEHVNRTNLKVLITSKKIKINFPSSQDPRRYSSTDFISFHSLFPRNNPDIVFGNPFQESKQHVFENFKTQNSAIATAYSSSALQRIGLQMELKSDDRNTDPKVILLYYVDKTLSNERFFGNQCKVNNCRFSRSPADYEIADVVVFREIPAHLKRPLSRPNQLWIYYQLESPLHTRPIPHGLSINWTATYRLDSILPVPYGIFKPYTSRYNTYSSSLTTPPNGSLLTGKKKLIAWFVSNCKDKNGRLKYVRELQKYVQVDIYGDCGTLECKKESQTACLEMLRHDYKFYLAFENSNCHGYITEKFFNALRYDVVPVVMGARVKDYEMVAPKGSFIHVDNYVNPKALADYLKELGRNERRYRQFFDWKNKGAFLSMDYQCQLCSMVQLTDKYQLWYKDIQSWWGTNTCLIHNGSWTNWS